MPSITVPFLNDLSVFQNVMQDENVSEVKRILIETVTQMGARRWNWGCFDSTYRIMKREAESDLLKALNISSSMNEIKQALCNYKQQLNDVQHRRHSQGNTSAFMRGIDFLIGQPFIEPKVCQQESALDSNKNPQFSGISFTPGSPAKIPESIHIGIRNAMEKAGYYPDERGMCYGVAWTALLACVRQDGQAYMQRMQYLTQMDTFPLSCALDTHQVYPFFDAVTLSMANYKNMSGYEKGIGYPGRQEVAFPGRVIGGHEPGYQVPVVKHAFIAECTPETFIRFLQHTRENNKGIPFGMMIHYPDHTITIGFDGNKWLAVDHNSHYYTETRELLYTFLHEQSSGHKDGKMIVEMELVASDEHSLNINNDALVVNAKKSVSVSLALYVALRYGDVNVTTDCIKVIGQQAHTPETLLELLTCKDAEGRSGFYMSLHNGHSEVVMTFIQASAAAITTLSRSEEERAELLYRLLICKTADYIPGFFMTLQRGYSDAITTFIQTSTAVIARLSLSNTEKAKWLCDLLSSKRTNGTPGFFVTLQKGHSEAITAFIQTSAAAIASLPLAEVQKAKLLYDLLASKRTDGTPGLYMALQEGDHDGIIAFIQTSAAAIGRLSLSNTEKVKLLSKLLASKRSDGLPGFYMTLQKEHHDSITAFIRASAAAIAILPLSNTEKVKLLSELLSSKRPDGLPGFHMALREGYTDVISTFIKESSAAIMRFPLSDKEKTQWLYELLASKAADDTPGFYMTLENGHSETITAFIQASTVMIASLPLPEEQKTGLFYKLLASKRADGAPGFYMTLQGGYPEAITAFIRESAAAIVSLTLSKKQKAKLLYELLASKRGDGLPGFYMTLQNGYPEAITAFIQESTAAIAALSLSKKQKTRLLHELITFQTYA